MRISGVLKARGASASAVTAGPNVYRQMLLKQIFPVGLLLALAPFVLETLSALDFRTAFAQLLELPFYGWVFALGLTIISYMAIGCYDGVVHRILQTGETGSAPRFAGMVSIALSQTTGFGLVAGTLARWRMLPNCTIRQSFAVTATVGVFFLGGWAFVTGVAMLVLSHGLNVPQGLAWFAVLASAGVVAVSLIQPFGLRLPSIAVLVALTGWIAIDLLTAALAFWLVLPSGIELPLAALIPAFFIAFTFGLLSGAPAGIGPFEITLLALLPHVEPEALLCGLIAFRVIYFAVPAILAVIVLAMGPRNLACHDAAIPAMQPIHPHQRSRMALWDGQAERGLVHQGQLALILDEHLAPRWLARGSRQSVIALHDPLMGTNTAQNWESLRHVAKDHGKLPFLYKCSARVAAKLRRTGAHVMAISQDAIVSTPTYTLDTSTRRQLRRKLRNAEKAGIQVVEADSATHLVAMTALDADWQALHGRAKGFSMGRFSLDYVVPQKLFIAFDRDAAIAFVSFHATRQEWTLDLMRHGADLPDGTMHLLVHTALMQAKECAVARVSLAAVPLQSHPLIEKLPVRLRDTARKSMTSKGLRQFKASFAPNWITRYAVANDPVGMGLGLWDSYKEIHAPVALLPVKSTFSIQTAFTKIMKTMNLPQPKERDT